VEGREPLASKRRPVQRRWFWNGLGHRLDQQPSQQQRRSLVLRVILGTRSHVHQGRRRCERDIAWDGRHRVEGVERRAARGLGAQVPRHGGCGSSHVAIAIAVRLTTLLPGPVCG